MHLLAFLFSSLYASIHLSFFSSSLGANTLFQAASFLLIAAFISSLHYTLFGFSPQTFTESHTSLALSTIAYFTFSHICLALLSPVVSLFLPAFDVTSSPGYPLHQVVYPCGFYSVDYLQFFFASSFLWFFVFPLTHDPLNDMIKISKLGLKWRLNYED